MSSLLLHSSKGRVPKNSKREGQGSSLQMQGQKRLGALLIEDQRLDLMESSLKLETVWELCKEIVFS